jgi:hypothetical protein
VRVPRGYTRTNASGTTVVARADVLDGILAALNGGATLHAFARSIPSARAMHGREAAFAITFPGSGLPVVVRHNRHGGALRAITGDLFVAPTRAPMELDVSLELRARNVLTPAIVAYAVYPAGIGFARSDVVTEEIPDSQDFGSLLLATTPESEDRLKGWNAVKRLLKRLASARARHHDLNVKNVLLRRTADDLFAAYALDVDRVELDCTRRDAYAGNRARLRRSVEKWRDTRGAQVSAAEIEALRHRVPSIP